MYLCVVRVLRWKYQAKFEAGTLTPLEAQEVVQLISMYDMPFLVDNALAFANFNTYAIPTISRLLCETRQLATEEHVARRYADTDLSTTVTWLNSPLPGRSVPPGSSTPTVDPRVSLSIARVNWIHAKYKIKWIERYGWRELSPLEKHALFVFWSEVGRWMNLQDIPTTMEAYAEAHMVPAQTNQIVAKHTIDELLFAVPHSFGLRHVAEGLARTLLEDRVRFCTPSILQLNHRRQPEVPTYARYLVPSLLRLATITQRHLLLPRRKPFSIVQVDLPEFSPSGPWLFPNKFTSKPWYKPRRDGLWASVDWLLVVVGWHTDVPSAAYKWGGYKLHELHHYRCFHIIENGFTPDGHEQVFEIAEGMQGCPIPDAWKCGKFKTS
ncbi:hypothetical protein FB45DRAFT_981213 [Roridomyces roridus]|uniref:ER-bound oxygenase mpaB/mpaB'/Rubber oxygenase catalytic domain-containing protein n=1 Tax=Roridomyces roridus TaxID=1738132 RepID=A0AAD7BEF6_9AGAR|nr:hypothetical protein FB45DRAFT_981213 [Roridomyces roridus]